MGFLLESINSKPKTAQQQDCFWEGLDSGSDFEQPQVGSPPVSIPFMIAVAHPTPSCTRSAPGSQFLAQAPHSMQRSLSTIVALLFSIFSTDRGHTSTHLLHPVQRSISSFRLTTWARYLKRVMVMVIVAPEALVYEV
jgi:hypothetical protein